MRALIVDDSQFVRQQVRRMLQERGIECEEAADGQAGMDLIRAGGPFELAFVDWNMPVMNGLEMLRHVRSETGEDIKVIMVTAEGDRENIRRALDMGADEYLMKPFDREALGEKLALLGIEPLP